MQKNTSNKVDRVIKATIMEYIKNQFEAQHRESGLKEIKPEDVIEPEFLDSYTERIEAIWHQVVKLNSNVYCLKHIHKSPFDLFEPMRKPFWILVKDSMFESSIMIINKILIDTDGEALTLHQLKNKIVNCFIKEEYKEQFNAVFGNYKDLRVYQFGKNNNHIEEKTKGLR